MLAHYQAVGIILCIVLSTSFATDDATLEKKKGKLFPVFQVITFSNDICVSTGSQNGTCYTAAECTAKGGVASGTCASSYGVCCVFSINCGTTSSQNCTYFQSTGSETGACRVNICPCSSNICQLRLDFNTFSINGPTTVTTSVAKTIAGQVLNGGTKTVSDISQCQTDTFSVTNPSGGSPPIICGLNTGQHMYVDSSTACNELAFQLGAAGTGATVGARSWSIKITQYACDYPNLAPPGCTQYFFGSSVGSVQTYNYAGGQHLANQDQNICVRICWTTVTKTDFQVSGVGATAAGVTKQSSCCGYGSSGKKAIGGDCATIPGAERTSAKPTLRGYDHICGSGTGLAVANSMATVGVKNKSVCSDTVPFSIRFLSDNYEFYAAETMKNQNGFMLTYIETGTGC